VVLAECLAAYLFLPDASETVAVASAVSHPKSETELPDDRSSELEAVDQVEVDLEEFSVTAFQPASGTTLRIDFHLYGTVATQDVAQFRVLMEKSVHRFREQVIVIVRSAELTDLTDAGLGLIKRRILEKTNRMLGEPLLKSVIVSDYSFIEQ
jgi:flagellar FliL protein